MFASANKIPPRFCVCNPYQTKGFGRIFSRFEKLEVLFLGFISFALILDALR